MFSLRHQFPSRSIWILEGCSETQKLEVVENHTRSEQVSCDNGWDNIEFPPAPFTNCSKRVSRSRIAIDEKVGRLWERVQVSEGSQTQHLNRSCETSVRFSTTLPNRILFSRNDLTTTMTDKNVNENQFDSHGQQSTPADLMLTKPAGLGTLELPLSNNLSRGESNTKICRYTPCSNTMTILTEEWNLI